jgi:hypothetical protein
MTFNLTLIKLMIKQFLKDSERTGMGIIFKNICDIE